MAEQEQVVYILSSVYTHDECCQCADNGEPHDETFIDGLFSSRESAERYAAEDSDGPLVWSAQEVDMGNGCITLSDHTWFAGFGDHARFRIVRYTVTDG